MNDRTEQEQLGRVRERFTRTAKQFARFALASRAEDAERLVAIALEGAGEPSRLRALDLACGPGTFTLALAPRVGFVFGFDLTPPMLREARKRSTTLSARCAYACADAGALPLADGVLDLAVCGYSVHHFFRPARAVAELARVVRRGGRVAVTDLIVPEGADPEIHNRIERVRDASHVATLRLTQLCELLASAGLRILAEECGERVRNFDEWMQTAGVPAGTPAYTETRQSMEATLSDDAAGFHPRMVPSPSGPALRYVQTSARIVAEKP